MPKAQCYCVILHIERCCLELPTSTCAALILVLRAIEIIIMIFLFNRESIWDGGYCVVYLQWSEIENGLEKAVFGGVVCAVRVWGVNGHFGKTAPRYARAFVRICAYYNTAYSGARGGWWREQGEKGPGQYGEINSFNSTYISMKLPPTLLSPQSKFIKLKRNR